MTDQQRLEMKISDYILEVVDLQATRGDVQSVAEITARLIITEVELYINGKRLAELGVTK